MKKKTFIIPLCLLLLACLMIIVFRINSNRKNNTEVTYRETTVALGNLTVGVTQNGTVDIGTIEQLFELDMSALERTDSTGGGNSNSTNSSNFPGMSNNMDSTRDIFGQIFGMADGNQSAATGNVTDLKVEEVCVSVGQEVKQDDVLYLLEESNVEKLQEELESDVEKAKSDLESIYAQQILSKQTAEYNYESSKAYGAYSDMEYQAAILSLQEMVSEKEAALSKATNLLDSYAEQLSDAQKDYQDALDVWNNCTWSCENTNKWEEPYEYVMYFEMAQTAQNTVESLLQKIEQLENNLEQAQNNVTTYTKELSEAKRNLDLGKLSAKETSTLRTLAYSTAEETYDIALSYLEEEAKNQEKVYEDAKEKWEEFSSHIKDNAVCAKYDGVITSVDLEVGDTINTNETLVTLYDRNEVNMTVTIDEGDMSDIALGGAANASFTAYPDLIFQGVISEISEASTDSYGNVTYEVTATLQGDVSGLFQGMTGEISFITKDVEEVLYISNRAVIREGTKSYVKVREDNGNIRKLEVKTGFSDGVNVEILEGLKEGDVVLIESKVKES